MCDEYNVDVSGIICLLVSRKVGLGTGKFIICLLPCFEMKKPSDFYILLFSIDLMSSTMF